jgi:hypothetical protein
VIPLALFAINFFICRPLFSVEYLHHMNSVEGMWVAMARYAARNWPDVWWFPLWLGGVPYQNTCPPLLPFMVAGVSMLFRISPALSFHAVVAFFYCLGPALAYWMALRLSGSRAYGFWVGLAWSLVSPSAWVLPYIARELGSPWRARRLESLTVHGDGPYVVALGLVPLAIVLLDMAIARRKPARYLLAALGMALVALTSWVGAVLLALAVLSFLLASSERAEAGAPACRPVRLCLTVLGLGLLAYLMASPWVPPSTVYTVQFNVQTIGGDYRDVYRTMLWCLPAVGACLALLKFLLALPKASRFLQFSLFFLFFTAGITLLGEWARVSLVPQPGRLHLAMELAVCLGGAAVAQAALRRVSTGAKAVIACALVFLAVMQFTRYRAFARALIQPVAIERRIEYQTARWLDAHMDGARVMVSGGTSYWLNVFSDTPQLSGIEAAAGNWMTRVALYVIHTGQNAGEKDGEISVLWLKALGVHAVAVSGPNSEEYYKPYRNPRKFEGLLEPVWRAGDDTIYRVPARSLSLAHAVLREELVERPPVHGLEVASVGRYVAALDDPARPLAPFAWRSARTAQIVATLKPAHLLSVQVSFHPGWHASANGRPARLFADGLGLLAIEPQCAGPCTVNLWYDGGLEMLLARIASWASLVLMLVCIFVGIAQRRLADRVIE